MMFENITRKFYYPGLSDFDASEPGDSVDPILPTPASAAEVHSSPKGKLYADSEEKFLKRVVLYIVAGDPDDKLCYDPDGLVPVRKNEALDLFLKNLMVACYAHGVIKNTYYTPIKLIPPILTGGPLVISFDDNISIPIFDE